MTDKKPTNSPITDEEIVIFLDVYRKTRSQSTAALAAGRSYVGFYALRKKNPKFKTLFEEARAEIFEKLEEEAIRRAFEGVERAKYYQGEIIGTEVEYSDRMLQFMLERGWPERFAPTSRTEVTGKDGTALIPAATEMSDNELARRVAFILTQAANPLPSPEAQPALPKPEEPSVH